MVSAHPPARADVLIVGGGVIGLAAAWYLARAGRSVHVLDRGRAGHGASRSNCGLVTPSHAAPIAGPGMPRTVFRGLLRRDAPFRVKPRLDPSFLSWGLAFLRRCNAEDAARSARAKAGLLLLSREATPVLLRDAGIACEWEEAGLLVVYRTRAAMDKDARENAHLAPHGILVESLDAAQLAAREPALLPGLLGAHFYPQDAHLRPETLLTGLARAVAERGVTLEENTPALGFRTANGRVTAVDTPQGPREGAEVLLATGAWSGPLARQLGLKVPIQPGKGYSLTMDRPAHCPRHPLLLRERRVAVTPWGSGFRLGGTMEFAGFDDRLDPVRLGALTRGAADYLRGPLPAGRREEWAGWRPMTPDDLPLLGRAPGYTNLTVAAGHCMLGTTLAAGTGQVLAELLAGAAPSVDLAPFSPARVGR
jgi:D-amino-acid dehydrogenase